MSAHTRCLPEPGGFADGHKARHPARRFPLALSEARSLAGAARLETTVARIAGRVFVSLHEPGCASAPAACFEPGSEAVFAGRRMVTPAEAGRWLAAYRNTADSYPDGGLFTRGNPSGSRLAHRGGERDRRLAHLAPHLVPGPDYLPAVAAAVTAMSRDRGGQEAEAQLREAEYAAGPLILSPAREAAVITRIRAGAARWHQLTGDPARYIAGREAIQAEGSLRATWREEEWIREWIAAHPGVLTAQPPPAPDDDGGAGESRRLQGEAKAALDAGGYVRALALIDEAEFADPSQGSRLARIRAVIKAAAKETAPSQHD